MAGKQGRSGPPQNKNAVRHGYYAYKSMLDGQGLDRRTSLYIALRDKEEELAETLGGNPSPQQWALIVDTVKTLLYIGSIDDYLSGLNIIVRRGRVHNVLIERTRLASHLKENLKILGMKGRIPFLRPIR